MNDYYDPFSITRSMYIGPTTSFRDYVTAITTKRNKPKTVRRNKKSKKNRR